ncbi:MAG: DMT family transporter [Crocinitomicaceae bacterium]|nr:DMT family transporter [Crocinitomicaceae bacterium]
MFSKYKYHLLLHFIIFLWGFTGILGKLIALEALYIVWYRVGIASLVIFLFLLFKGKKLGIPKSHIIKVSFVGLVVAAHWVTFYTSIQLSTASLGILCLSTTTLHVAWLEPIIMKKKFSWIEFLLGLVVVGGIYFVSGDFSPDEYWAVLAGCISAFLAAFFAVSNARFVEDLPSTHISMYELAMGFIGLSIYLAFVGKIDTAMFSMTISDLSWLLFLAIVCTSFAFLVTIDIVKKLGAFTVSLSINLEPVYTIILAIFILKEHEQLGTNFYIGSVLIIMTVIANGIIKNQQKKRSLRALH